MGIGEIGGGFLILLLVVGGALFYVLTQQRNAIEESKTPSLPPKRAAQAPSPAAATDSHAIVELQPGVPGMTLAVLLRDHAHKAEARGLRPFFEVGAIWCPPSKMFGEVLEDPRMQAALAGVYLIRADMDAFADDPKLAELGVRGVPVFYELDAEGQATGRSITGAAWGADTVANMSETMAKFCA